MKYISEKSLVAIDNATKNAQDQAINNDDLIARLNAISVMLEYDISEISKCDPMSEMYKSMIMDFHNEIIGKTHQVEMEGLPSLNLEHEKKWPFPWGTKSPETVGKFLIDYGCLIRAAALPAHARILEVGCGMGSLTWNLARMGYRVDALDPNETQCEFVRAITADFPCPPTVAAQTLTQWLATRTKNYKYDAVIFFESFHHLIDHHACLDALVNQDHLDDDGIVVLGAEPIFEKQNDALPYPWGPRLDGHSMRAMRNWGWLELGFTKSYLYDLFDRVGLAFNATNNPMPWLAADIVIGKRKKSVKAADESLVGRYSGNAAFGIDFARHGFPDDVALVKGLSFNEPWGRWSLGREVEITFKNYLPENFVLTLVLGNIFGPNVGKKILVQAGECRAVKNLEEIEKNDIYQFQMNEVSSRKIKISVPHPIRPKDILELNNEDNRQLGLGFASLKIDAAPATR
ncbi:MAG: DUF7024 domain-containing protein [Janthinobacterium lividum]